MINDSPIFFIRHLLEIPTKNNDGFEMFFEYKHQSDRLLMIDIPKFFLLFIIKLLHKIK